MVDGEPSTEMSADKSRALLAYLVLESDRAHDRNTLIVLFWVGYKSGENLGFDSLTFLMKGPIVAVNDERKMSSTHAGG